MKKKLIFTLMPTLIFFLSIIYFFNTIDVYAEEKNCLQYDLNLDGTVDNQDALIIDTAMASAEGEDRYDSRADLNLDKTVNGKDKNLLIDSKCMFFDKTLDIAVKDISFVNSFMCNKVSGIMVTIENLGDAINYHEWINSARMEENFSFSEEFMYYNPLIGASGFLSDGDSFFFDSPQKTSFKKGETMHLFWRGNFDTTESLEKAEVTFTIDKNNFLDETNEINNTLTDIVNIANPGKYNQICNINNAEQYDKLKGKIILKVEQSGEAYYTHPSNKKMYYLGLPKDAFAIMREQGIGITNANLSRIPVALSNLTGADTDSDSLPDLFEDAIGTDKNKKDTDNDGYDDKAEILSNYFPSGSGKIKIDNNFADGKKGQIFLQVEKNGEAWYINPTDGKRYFLGRPADAFQIMRNIGLGISNNDFDKL